ncbi:MAG TPA: D-alanyl-D-alanine carboxypeptidase family protein [Gammaproteobacteria bacterium]|nr:D-alanyl-D-alanine carboxypeptidase family protein [Gammaproteobacteria bacterium]
MKSFIYILTVFIGLWAAPALAEKSSHGAAKSAPSIKVHADKGAADKKPPDKNEPASTAAPATPAARPPAPATLGFVPAPPAVNAQAWLLMDFATGQALAEDNADARMEPASLTKMMTIYTVSQALKEGKIKLTDQVPVSEKAWRTGGGGVESSSMFLKVGSRVSLEDLMKGDIVQSGNDASVALAEYVAGSEDAFADMMNQNAARLGMTGTHFVNSHGLPAPDHYTTARDLGKLAAALIRDFPDVYKWFSIREFTFNNIKQQNRNKLLWRDGSVDGIKTGFHNTAGYCLAASAVRGDMRLIAIILDSEGENARADAAEALLGYGFRFFETRKLYAAHQAVQEQRVWKGAVETASLGLAQDLYVSLPRGQENKLKRKVDVQNPLVAPLAAGESRGALTVQLGDKTLAQRPLIVLQPVAPAGWTGQVMDTVKLWLQ